MADERTAVLVVGAGPTGCAAALFLARRGVDVLLVERHQSTSIQPRVTGQSPRTMELLGYAGVADHMLAAGARAGAGAPHVEADPGGTEHGQSEQSQNQTEQNQTEQNASHEGQAEQGRNRSGGAARSPAPAGFASLDALEPILIEHALHAGARVRFATEVVDLRQDSSGVAARLLDRWNERLTTVRASYVIAADGQRSALRAGLGIGRHGPGAIRHFVGVVFEADQAGPMVTSFEYRPGRGESMLDFTTETVADLIRLANGDPELDVRVHSVQAWEVAAAIADRFADGRFFLAGDAAWVTPPAGSLAVDAAVADAFDLAWKLAEVLHGAAAPALLDSYDAERRAFAEQAVHAVLADEDLAAVAFGCRAPHVPLRSGDTTLSTVDLFGDGWTLLTGEAGGAWHQAAMHAAARVGVRLTAYGLGPELADPTGQLPTAYGIGDAGASLVRPDGVVAWHTSVEPPDLVGTLIGVLRSALGHPVGGVARSVA